MWLLINNIHEKIWRWFKPKKRKRTDAIREKLCHQLRHPVSFFNRWPIRMLGLFPLFHWSNSFLHCYKKNCTALNQSEWRNFSYILFTKQDNLILKKNLPRLRTHKKQIYLPQTIYILSQEISMPTLNFVAGNYPWTPALSRKEEHI